MAIDHPGDDRRAARVDDLEALAAWILLAVRRSDPGDPVVLDEDAHCPLEPVAAAVGDRSIAIQDAVGS